MVSYPADIGVFYKGGREMAKWIKRLEQSVQKGFDVYT